MVTLQFKMADKVVLVVQQLLKPIKLIKWKVNEGNSISIGCVYLLYELDDDDKHVVCKLKSTQAGTVYKLHGQEGDVVKPGECLLEIQACTHPTVMRDMCAECGADLRKDDAATEASVPMIHSVPELKVSLEQAKKIGQADLDRLLKDRKLVLLVDLDQTLIHTTNDNIPANIKDVYHFQLNGAHSPWYHTRLRPGTHKFLTNISPLFELHICTFGARNYAHMIARFLDLDGQLFSQRILSRDECFNPMSKTANLTALFPCGDNMVCIIDDREDVWSYATNLIHVKPYHFFQHTGDINAPPGLDKHESDDKECVDLTKVKKLNGIKDDSLSNGDDDDGKDKEIITNGEFNNGNNIDDDNDERMDEELGTRNYRTKSLDVIDDTEDESCADVMDLTGNENKPASTTAKNDETDIIKDENVKDETTPDKTNEIVQSMRKDQIIKDDKINDDKMNEDKIKDDKIKDDKNKEDKINDDKIKDESSTDEINLQKDDTTIKDEITSEKMEVTTAKTIKLDDDETTISKDTIDDKIKDETSTDKINLQKDDTTITDEITSEKMEVTTDKPIKLDDDETTISKDITDDKIKDETSADEINLQKDNTTIKDEITSEPMEVTTDKPIKLDDDETIISKDTTDDKTKDEIKTDKIENAEISDEPPVCRNIDDKIKVESITDEKSHIKLENEKITDEITSDNKDDNIKDESPAEDTKLDSEKIQDETDSEKKCKDDDENKETSDKMDVDEMTDKPAEITRIEVEKTADETSIKDESETAKQVQINSNSLSNNNDKYNENIEIDDPDDYLLYLEDILKTIHKAFYEKYDELDSGNVPDLKKVIPLVRNTVLKNMKLVFSGLVPTHVKLEQSKAYQVATGLGAVVTQDLEEDTTHLVAVRPGTAKVNVGRRRKNLKIVTPDWLWTCAERWCKAEEKLYPLSNKGSKNRHPPPHCSSPEHISDALETSSRKRTPSGRFMDTINPLMSFSSADIADMDREVEDIFNESESDGESSKKIPDTNQIIMEELKKTEEDESSSSDESLSGDHPHGYKARKRSRDEQDIEDESTADEYPSVKFRRGEELSSDLDIGQESNSEGSVEAPDEIDDGDWNMMGAALEREFLANN